MRFSRALHMTSRCHGLAARRVTLRRKCRRCHGLVPWSLTFVAKRTPNRSLWMPRACAVETHVCCYLARNVNPPRDKPVASGLNFGGKRCSDLRETPRDKPVASARDKPVASGLNFGGKRCSDLRETPRDKPVASARDKPVASGLNFGGK